MTEEIKRLKFNKEEDGNWYIDLPKWPFSHHNLMMVAGADKLLDLISKGKDTVKVNVLASDRPMGYEDTMPYLIRTSYTIIGGGYYDVRNQEALNRINDKINVYNLWLCPVTLFVFGCYPKFIYIDVLN